MRKELFELLDFIRTLYPNEKPIGLHVPRFNGNEKKYLSQCIDSTFVSYVGEFVTQFEEHLKSFTGAKHAVAMANGTAALQMALVSAGIQSGDEVITQALTFVATANGIKHAGGEPVFIDVDKETLGMSPNALSDFLDRYAEKKNGIVVNKVTNRRIFSVMPMHTFGLSCEIQKIKDICDLWGIALIEDAAEALGSWAGKTHLGNYSLASCLSFNGNKPLTTGAGGALITNDDEIAKKARHISTTAKAKHPWEFFHDELGWNLRMSNLNAAIGCAQMEILNSVLENKRETAALYLDFCSKRGIEKVTEMSNTKTNYWLNAIILKDRSERDTFLQESNSNGIQTRPIWTLMSKLPMYKDSFKSSLENSEWLEDRIVNIPSSYRLPL